MGKTTGFLEYKRVENEEVPALERIKNFQEFHRYNNEEERCKQGARCMNCGVPFCQSAMNLSGMVVGCPLHNLIPEWNDAIYRKENSHALDRLLKTNPFPEFTGRVCPALCEKACICGQDDQPVTNRDNELFLIEKAYEEGRMKANIPHTESGKKVAIVGAGPAGLAAAATLRKRGHAVTVYEREDRIGGLLMYGIPNMKLDKEAIFRRQRILEEEGIVFKTNVEVGKDIKKDELEKEYDAVILSCGAKEPRPLNVKGIEGLEGVHFAVDFLSEITKNVLDSKKKIKNSMQAKNKNIVVVGGGDTGNDCIGTVIRLGCKSVTALEMMPKPPVERAINNPWPEWPKTLRTDYGHQEAIEVFGKDPRVFSTTVKEVYSKEGKISGIKTVQVVFKDGKLEEVPGSEKELKCDMLLIAAGFIGAQQLAPKALGVKLTNRGVVDAKEDDYKTNVDKIFAAGDMRRGQSLVVWAIAEGKRCAAKVDEYLMGYKAYNI